VWNLVRSLLVFPTWRSPLASLVVSLMFAGVGAFVLARGDRLTGTVWLCSALVFLGLALAARLTRGTWSPEARRHEEDFRTPIS
jgi:hypothetical protein